LAQVIDSKASRLPVVWIFGFACCLLMIWGNTAGASTLDEIGVTLLRGTTTNLNGSGLVVADAEAAVSNSAWEANPGDPKINLPVSDFSWYMSPSAINIYPNAIGTDSWHSDYVGGYFYGASNGVSTNVAHIENIEADYYFSLAVPALTPFAALVVNQSFTGSQANQPASDPAYDSYANQFGTLFVSGVGNSGQVLPPSTCYNGIAVGAYGGATSAGPTLDNGRAKPDLCAPAGATSFAAPLVAGSATLLIQAALRGDGGPQTGDATDIRTLKALLLNGAVKPAAWSNPSPSPLDPLYGAGVLNVFNSYHQLLGGRHVFVTNTSVSNNAAHPVTGSSANVGVLSGWDFDLISNLNPGVDSINHYCFEVTNNAGPFTATITLTWSRQTGQSAINNLGLYLYNMDTGALVGASTSVVDNVQHVYVPALPPGRYDAEVLKHGGGYVSASETYALAFDFFALPVTVTTIPGGIHVMWPVYPAGFVLESNLNPAVSSSWSSNLVATPFVTNNLNSVIVGPSTAPVFFRLVRVP
jgi:hypothetical protein